VFGTAKNQVINLHHHERWDKVSVHRVSHPRSAGFDLQTTAPALMIGINLIAKAWNAILAVEDRTLDLTCPL
jgi:hypothetical protein